MSTVGLQCNLMASSKILIIKCLKLVHKYYDSIFIILEINMSETSVTMM